MIEIGDMVMWTNRELHLDEPEFYPSFGTVGEVTAAADDGLIVQWPYDSTSMDDCWFCNVYDVRKVV